MAETAQDASAPLSRNDKMKDEDVDEGVCFFFPMRALRHNLINTSSSSIVVGQA
jgi:hypothetical protein